MEELIDHLTEQQQHQQQQQSEEGISAPPFFEQILGPTISKTQEDKNSLSQYWIVQEHTVIIILQIILLVILCLVGTITNALVFWIFNRRPALRSLSNRFVLSLVTANVMISTLISPLLLFDTIIAQYWLLPCISPLIATIANSVLFSAIYSTLLIATDRFYAVTSPLHYSMTITRSRSQIMIIISWLCATLLSLPTIILYTSPLDSPELHRSVVRISIIIQFTLGYAFPLFCLIWLYLRMYSAAHRNSERTRKHSISGDLLTVMDGTTSIIPQGIDFLTHYMNPFSKTPMSGAAQTAGHTANGVLVTVKKQRRRSSSGSSSSLLFREEGRAIKTAFFVLASYLICWTPHFVDQLQLLFSDDPTVPDPNGGGWTRFFGVTGMLLSSVLNPFIYVFRNKMAYKEVNKLLCGFVRELRRKKSIKRPRNKRTGMKNKPVAKNGKNNGGTNGTTAGTNGLENGKGGPETQMSLETEVNLVAPYSPDTLHNPPPTPLPKSPRRSSMKSLTPQSSLNSNSTQVNFTTNDSSSSADSPVLILNKPPFIRSLTLPEQHTQNHVKFLPPILTKQKSCVQRTVSGPPVGVENRNGKPKELPSILTQARRTKFTRQDSICSIVSNDSVLMFYPEEKYPVGDRDCVLDISDEPPRSAPPITATAVATTTVMTHPHRHPLVTHSLSNGHATIMSNNSLPLVHHQTLSGTTTRNGTPSHSSSNESGGSFSSAISRSCYLRQDSNFSDASHKTNDSGVVSDMAVQPGQCPPLQEIETTFTTFTSPDKQQRLRQQQQQMQMQQQGNPNGNNTRLIFCTGQCVHDLPLLQTTI